MATVSGGLAAAARARPAPTPTATRRSADFRNKLKIMEWRQKSSNTNPRRGGPWHFRAPSRMVWKAIRGMLPHKIQRGAEALARLKVFEGVPPEYAEVKRVVVPSALRVTGLKPGRAFANLGKLCHEVRGGGSGCVCDTLPLACSLPPADWLEAPRPHQAPRGAAQGGLRGLLCKEEGGHAEGVCCARCRCRRMRPWAAGHRSRRSRAVLAFRGDPTDLETAPTSHVHPLM